MADVIVPAAVGAVVGLGVGVLLGRTVFAPKLPVPTVRYAAGAGLDGSVRSGGAVMDAGLSVESEPSLKALARSATVVATVGRNGADKPSPAKRSPPKDDRRHVLLTVDDVLAKCPTREEMETIRRQVDISFDEVPAVWGCTQGGQETSEMLSVYNAFRLMKFLRFDAPMPILGAVNLYDWWVSQGIAVQVTSDDDDSNAPLGQRRVFIRSEVLRNPNRRWGPGWGMANVIGLLLHEARHAMVGGLGHPSTCPGNPPFGDDPSLAYGGAWAVHYWYFRWLAEHSGTSLTLAQKMYAAEVAAGMAQRMCNFPR